MAFCLPFSNKVWAWCKNTLKDKQIIPIILNIPISRLVGGGLAESKETTSGSPSNLLCHDWWGLGKQIRILMETNPNPILHFNERPGASPDYRFDYVEKNINLGSGAAPVARNKGFTRIETASIPLLRYQVQHSAIQLFLINLNIFTKIQNKRSLKVVDVFNLIGGFLNWFSMLQSWQTKARKSEEKWGKAEFMLFIVWVFLRQLRRSVGNGAHYLKWRYQHFSAVLFQVE